MNDTVNKVPTNQEIKDQVLSAISQNIGTGLDSIDVNDNLFDDLNASKLEKAEVIASLEDKYHITFDIDQLPELNTALSIIEYIEDNVE